MAGIAGCTNLEFANDLASFPELPLDEIRAASRLRTDEVCMLTFITCAVVVDAVDGF